MSRSAARKLVEPQDAELARYRVLGADTVLGLVLGLLSPVAFLEPVLWAVPLLGIVFSALALARILKNAPALAGRRAALVGLILSILFGAAAPTDWLAYRWLVRREARQFAEMWFDFLADGQPHKAYQLTIHPDYRHPVDDKLWDLYRKDKSWQGHLKAYTERPLVRALLALGQQAHARYYATPYESFSGQNSQILHVYAITFNDGVGKKTFFAGLHLKRWKLENGTAQWHIERTEKDFLPPGLSNGPAGASSTSPASSDSA